MTIAMALRFDSNSTTMFQFAEVHEWIPQFGVSYALGVDGIALVLIAMATVLTPVCILASWHDVDDARLGDRARNAKSYFALLLLLETFMIGVFAATDVFLFYVLFEAMLVPMYFIIGSYGGVQRSYAAVKFLLYSLAGGLLMLAAVIGLYVVSDGGSQAFLFENLLGHGPGHRHRATAVRRLLRRVRDQGSTVAGAHLAPGRRRRGPARRCRPARRRAGQGRHLRDDPALPSAVPRRLAVGRAGGASSLAVIGILYGALLAIGQTDMKRLIAYTSISHFGFIVLGIFAMTTQGQSGSTLYMVNHGFSTAALFLIAGLLISRRGSRLIADYGGVQRVAPMLAGTFLVAGLSSLALPGLSSFVSEFLVLVGTFTRYEVAAVVATGGIILASLYILLMYQRIMTGEPTEGTESMRDLDAREAWVVAPVIAIIIALGFFPKPLLDVINPAVDRTMQQVGVADPKPVVPGILQTTEGSGE